VKNRTRAAVLLLVAALSACAGSTNAVIQSLQYAVQKDTSVARAQLNPSFRYLRATVEGRVILLVLGYVDNHPQGPIQVWYSAQREVLRLQNGRVVGAVGLNAEWREVFLPQLPSWSTLAAGNGDSRWIRIRDVMPGYRFGVHDVLSLHKVPPPSNSAVQDLDARSLVWFEERFEPDGSGSVPDGGLPPARYAVAVIDGVEAVVYGEQCLTPSLCFSWQQWPAPAQTAKAAQQ